MLKLFYREVRDLSLLRNNVTDLNRGRWTRTGSNSKRNTLVGYTRHSLTELGNKYGVTPEYSFCVPVTSICCEIHGEQYLISEFLTTLSQLLRLSCIKWWRIWKKLIKFMTRHPVFHETLEVFTVAFTMYVCNHGCALGPAVRIICTLADIPPRTSILGSKNVIFSGATFGARIICERGYNWPVLQQILFKIWFLFCCSSQKSRFVVGAYVEAST
jgi:hypothetical protein